MRATIYVMAVGRMDETLQSFDMYADEGRMAGLQQVRGAAEDPPVPRREVGVGAALAGAVDFAAAL